MKVSYTILLLFIAAVLWIPSSAQGQIDPRLTLYDSQGVSYTAPDNSTVFVASSGVWFKMSLQGAPSAPFGLFLSMNQSPFPTNITPPPLFIMPPFFPIMAGPSLILDLAGEASFNGITPSNLANIGHDVDLLFQAYVQDPVNGFQLSNGILLRITPSYYKADLALMEGEDLTDITAVGRLEDSNAGDNETQGGGLLNGATLVPDPDILAPSSSFKDTVPPPTNTPQPSNSIYLNGFFPLVPGDAGMNDKYKNYPSYGSHMHIYTRDEICRNNENENQQFLIVPVHNELGEKTHDLNVYHFRDNKTLECGFAVLNTMTNDYYELTGTRQKNILSAQSPWDCHVAISPDGAYMACVHKTRSMDHVNNFDALYLVNLTEVWDPSIPDLNFHARKVKLNDSTNNNYKASRVFAESMTFAGNPKPHVLFFICNRFNSNAGNPLNQEPPIENASVLWYTNGANKNSKGKYYKHVDLPPNGSGYNLNYFGQPATYNSPTDFHNELIVLRSEDNSAICMRAGSRYANYEGGAWDRGAFCWDILSIRDIQDSKTFNIYNVTQFKEKELKYGYFIHPFGGATNGWARAALNEDGSKVAFVDRNDGKINPTYLEIEDLYLAPTDGSKAGILAPVTTPVDFKDDFNDERTIVDPIFIDSGKVLFFMGSDVSTTAVVFPPKTDLFMYHELMGLFTNLSMTGPGEDPLPPFNKFGNIRPAGIFMAPSKKYVFFFRGDSGTGIYNVKTNLVGVDLENNYQLFDLTGNEFSSGFIPDTINEFPGNFYLGPESQNIIIAPTEERNLLFYTSKFTMPFNNDSHQVFMVNMDFPLASLPVTSFKSSETGIIDNLTADQKGEYIAFSRSNTANVNPTDGAYEEVYIVALNFGAYTRVLTKGFPFTSASIDGSFRFIPSISPSSPPELIYGVGTGGNPDQANNPEKARIWLYPLEGVGDPNMPSISFPLTPEKTYLLYNALPMN